MRKLLLLLLMIGALTWSAWADTNVWIDNLYYRLNSEDNTAHVIKPDSWTNHMDDHANIPATVSYNSVTYQVTEIENYAFQERTDLRTVTIGENITNVQGTAFSGCNHIETVNFNAVRCTHMFNESGYYQTRCVFNESVSTFTTLNIGNNVTRIPKYAFFSCSQISSLAIPSSVITIDDYAFKDCTGIQSSLVISSSLDTIGNYAFFNCTHLSGGLVIPNTLRTFGHHVFSGCESITSITVDVPIIQTESFFQCRSVTEVTIGLNVVEFKNGAFAKCPQINTVNFNAAACTKMKVNDLYDGQYYSPFFWAGNMLRTVNFGSYVSIIPDYAFNGCYQIHSLKLPDGLNSIGEFAFNECEAITSLVFPEGMHSIGSKAFSGCPSITTIHSMALVPPMLASDAFDTKDDILVYVPMEAEMDYALDPVWGTFPNLLSSPVSATVGNNTLYYSLDIVNNIATVIYPNQSASDNEDHWLGYTRPQGHLEIPGTIVYDNHSYNVTRIGDYAFEGCDGVQSVTIGENVDIVAPKSFEGCHNITTVHLNAVNCTQMHGKSDMYGTNYNSVFYDSRSVLTTISMGDGVTRIPDNAFIGLENITSPLSIPSTVTYIGDYAFKGCSNMTGNLTLPSNISAIGKYAFDHCTELTGCIVIPNTVTSIGSYAFGYCWNVTGISVDSPVIPKNAFYNDAKVSSLTIGPHVTQVDAAFEDCHFDTVNFNATNCTSMEMIQNGRYSSALCNAVSYITTLNIGDNVTTIPDHAFMGCTRLVSVNIPSTLNTLGEQSFYGCTGMTSLSIDVRVIPGNAFGRLNNLSSVTIGPHVTQIDGAPFKDCSNISTVNFNAVNCTDMKQTNYDSEYVSIFYESRYQLKTVNIGSEVLSLPRYAFKGCSGLKTISTACPIPPELYSNSFDYSKNIKLNILTNSVSLYKNHEYWSLFLLSAPIVIAGEPVNEYNANDISGPSIAGSVSYDFESNTLTLVNATIVSYDINAIVSSCSNLIINLVGNNTITSYVADAIRLRANTIIQGLGTLDVTSENRNAIWVDESLSINGGCTVTAFAKSINTNSCSVYGADGSILRVDNSKLIAKRGGTAYGSIGGFSEVQMIDCVVLVPQEVCYNSESHRFEDSHGVVQNGQILICKSEYDLWIKGIRVTALNANDVLEDGTVSFDIMTNTLTLNGAYINGRQMVGIDNKIDGLKIVLIGYNKVVSEMQEGIASAEDASLSIQGSGQLQVAGTTAIGVNANLTISGGCDVEAIANGYFNVSAIEDYGRQSTLTVDASSVVARAPHTNQGVIYGFNSLSLLNKADFVEPVGACWSNTNHRVEDESGNLVTEPVLIETNYYYIWVAGRRVHTGNMHDILEDGGSVSFEPATTTVTLNNAHIVTIYPGVSSQYQNTFNLNLIGENTITSESWGVASSAINTNIMGNGSLNVTAESAFCVFGTSMQRTITFSAGSSVTLYGEDEIFGGTDCTIVIDRADVRALGNSDSFRCDSLILNESAIVAPEGAVFENGCVRYPNHQPVIGEYVIISSPQPYELYVGGVQVSPVNKDDILGDGTVSYNPSSNVLTLDNVMMQNLGMDFGVYNLIPDLTIRLIGSNTIVSDYNSGIFSEEDFTIVGAAQDVLNVTGSEGILSYGDLTIQGGCHIYATATESYELCSGITISIEQSFTIINSFVTTQKSDGYPYQGPQPQLIGCTCTVPAVTYWNNEGYYDNASHHPVTGQVIFTPNQYDLTVKGVNVNTAIAPDVFCDGTVSYDPVNKVLTLNDADLSSNTWPGIYNRIPNLYIELINNNYISTTNIGVVSSENFIIGGSGYLDVRGSDGIYAAGCSLSIEGCCQVNATATSTGSHAGIVGEPGYSLTVDRGHVIAYTASTTKSSIYGFSNLYLMDGVTFLQPSNAVYNSSCVKEDGIEYIGEVEIGGIPYGFRVAGEEISSANADNIIVGVENGTVSYDPETHTLILDNAVIKTSGLGDVAVDNYDNDDFTIKLIGNNAIETSGGDSDYGIVTYALPNYGSNFTIQGPGTLACNHSILLTDDGLCNLVVNEGADVYFLGNIEGYCDAQFQLEVADATLRAHSVIGLHGYCDEPTSNGTIVEPAGVEYDELLECGSLAVNGEVAENIVIVADYDLSVAGVAVTSLNAHDIQSDYLINGSAHYDFSTKTLTLDNAYISSEDCPSVVWNPFGVHPSSLNIELVGNNAIQVVDTVGIDAIRAGVTLTGSGHLQMNADNGISVNTSFAMTDSCSADIISAYDWNGAIRGNDVMEIGPHNHLTVQGATNAIYGFNDLILDGVVILRPSNAVYNPVLKRLENVQGNPVTSTVEIGSTEFDLWIGDTRVTSNNASHLSDLPNVSGIIRYKPNIRTLTLQDASLNFGELECAITSQIEGLTIDLIGYNEIYASDNGIEIEDATTFITGMGSLSIYASYYGVNMSSNGLSNKILTIQKGANVSIYSGDYGIYADGILRVKNATVEVNCDYTAIYSDDVILDYVHVAEPEGAYYNEEQGKILDADGQPVTNRLVIEPLTYELYVAGIQVTAYNSDDILGDGRVSYNGTEHKLYLNGASIDEIAYVEDNYNGIESYIDDLTIVLSGDNSISSTFMYGILLFDDATICGSGTLEINSSIGVYGALENYHNPSLTLEGGCTVRTTNADWSIYLAQDSQYSGGVFTVDGSWFVASIEDGSVLVRCKELNLIASTLQSPNNGFLYEYQIVDANQSLPNSITISPDEYALYVEGYQVTALNAADVLGDGTVSYDHASRTLLLDGANISYVTDGSGILSYMEDLNIVLLGENTITGNNDGISLVADATISGSGSLHIDSDWGIYGYASGTVFPSLTIEGGCSVEIESDSRGVFLGGSDNYSGGVFSVNNSKVEISQSDNSGSAITCLELNLAYTEISTPVGGMINGYEIIDIDGNTITDHAIIEPCNIFTGSLNCDWDEPENWSKESLPTQYSKVYVESAAFLPQYVRVSEIIVENEGKVVVPEGAVLDAETISTYSVNQLIILEGGQVYCDSNHTLATLYRTIEKPKNNNDGWNLIAVPMTNCTIKNLTSNTYDIYSYDEDADQNEWQNYRQSSFNFTPGEGYLYANSATQGDVRVELVMKGTLVPSHQSVATMLSYGAVNESIRGFNLIGNPYPHNIDVNNIKVNGEYITDFYVLVDGKNLVRYTNGEIRPGEAFFVKAVEEGQNLVIGWRLNAGH